MARFPQAVFRPTCLCQEEATSPSLRSSLLALQHAVGTALPGKLPKQRGQELSGLHMPRPHSTGSKAAGGVAGNRSAGEGSCLPKCSAYSSAPPD